MCKVKADKNKIIIQGKTVSFDYKVETILEFPAYCVVLLIAEEHKYPENNIEAYDYNGNKIWNISQILASEVSVPESYRWIGKVSERFLGLIKCSEDFGLFGEKWFVIDTLTNEVIKDMYIRHEISGMQSKPKMYVREVTIEHIYYLLSGISIAFSELPKDSLDRNFMDWFGKWLIRWINSNINPEYSPQTAYWYDDIKKIAENEQDEVELFFRLCQLFFEDYDNLDKCRQVL